MRLNEMDCIVLEEALIDSLEQIQSGAPHFENTTGEAITSSIFSIASVRKKLKAIRQNPSQDFTAQELRIMYWAISDMRDAIRAYLETAPLSDPDRGSAIDTQKICNHLLREFSDLLHKGGIQF